MECTRSLDGLGDWFRPKYEPILEWLAASRIRLAVLGASAAQDSINKAFYLVQIGVVLSDMMSDEQYRQKMMDGSGIKHTSFCRTADLCFSNPVTP